MATKRKYPEGASESFKRQIDRLFEGAAYAYGFSDEKPGLSYWIVIAAMVLGVVLMMASGVRMHHA